MYYIQKGNRKDKNFSILFCFLLVYYIVFTFSELTIISGFRHRNREDSAYLSQGENVINSIISEQSTDVDTISGATFSSTGILEAVNDALSKAENA